MANWFQRIREGILTPTKDKKEAPDGLWNHCSGCKETITQKELAENLWVCPNCNFHERIGSFQYFSFLFDAGNYKVLFDELAPKDSLNFTDLKSYQKRIEDSQNKTGLKDAMQVASGTINQTKAVIAAMDFTFIGGSMGSVVGEKIARSINHCIKTTSGLVIVSKSGGARMMESALSLLQMAKTSAKLTELSKAKLPFISLLTDPTTGGVTASYAMLGDVNIAEPGALIGFAGPRVIKETIKKDLPKGFQKSEFLMEHGFLDQIVHRKHLKEELGKLLTLFAA